MKKLYRDKTATDNQTANKQHALPLHCRFIYFWITFRSILNLQKSSKKENLPFIHLPIQGQGVQHFVFYCRINAKRRKPPEEKKFSLFIHKSHNRAHSHKHTHTLSRASRIKIKSWGKSLSPPSSRSGPEFVRSFVIVNLGSENEQKIGITLGHFRECKPTHSRLVRKLVTR